MMSLVQVRALVIWDRCCLGWCLAYADTWLAARLFPPDWKLSKPSKLSWGYQPLRRSSTSFSATVASTPGAPRWMYDSQHECDVLILLNLVSVKADWSEIRGLWHSLLSGALDLKFLGLDSTAQLLVLLLIGRIIFLGALPSSFHRRYKTLKNGVAIKCCKIINTAFLITLNPFVDRALLPVITIQYFSGY